MLYNDYFWTTQGGTPMSEMLTGKQELFCMRYVELRKSSEAYRQAFGAEGIPADRVKQKAYKLKNLPHVSARIDQLERDIEGRFLATQGERRQLLWDVAQDNKVIKPDTAIKATSELNRMDPELRNPQMAVINNGPVEIIVHAHPCMINRPLDRLPDDSPPAIEHD